MRIANGATNRTIFFVAVDPTDKTTRETGLSSFSVSYALDDSTDVQMTTPTVTEVDSTNMPGVYQLLIDESGMTTLDAGKDTMELCVHITQASMEPVTRVFEIYRPETTEGNTLDVTSTGAAGIDWANIENPTTTQNLSATNIDTDQVVASVSGAVGSIATDGITASSIATGALTAAKFASGAFDAVWSVATRLLTAGTNIVLAKGVGVTGFNDPTAAATADAVWDEPRADHATAGTTGEALRTTVSGTVSNAVQAPTTTAFRSDDITEATADHFNGRVIVFTSGALLHQATRITDYELLSGEGVFTVETLTEAPANNDTFVIF